MIDGTSGKLLDQLVAGELDAVVVAEPPRALPDFFGTHPFLEEELVIVDYTTPTAGSVEPVRLRDVAERITVSYPPESGVRTLIDDAARRERADLRFPYTTSDPALHIALAKAGLGVDGRFRGDTRRGSPAVSVAVDATDLAAEGAGVDAAAATWPCGGRADRGSPRRLAELG